MLITTVLRDIFPRRKAPPKPSRIAHMKSRLGAFVGDQIERIYTSNFAQKIFSSSGAVYVNQLWLARMPYVEQAAMQLFKPGWRILEVGTWMGHGSTQIWLLHLPRDAHLVCIDKWGAYVSKRDLLSNPGNYSTMNNVPRTALNIALNAIESTGRSNVTVIKSDSAQALGLLQESSFDFIYIDGSHYYQNVKTDIVMAKRLLKEGGILCGDDLEVNPSPELIEIAKECTDLDYVCAPNTAAFHPGVLLAISEEVPRYNNYNGFWICQKVNGDYEPVDLE